MIGKIFRYIFIALVFIAIFCFIFKLDDIVGGMPVKAKATNFTTTKPTSVTKKPTSAGPTNATVVGSPTATPATDTPVETPPAPSSQPATSQPQDQPTPSSVPSTNNLNNPCPAGTDYEGMNPGNVPDCQAQPTGCPQGDAIPLSECEAKYGD